MESELTSGELAWKQKEAAQQEAENRTQALNEAMSKGKELEADPTLTAVEKATFGAATVFSGIVLVGLVMLTIVGFIFSPISQTLLFGLLALGTGLVSYVIWRGGQRVKGS